MATAAAVKTKVSASPEARASESSSVASPKSQPEVDESLYLIGRPQLKDFLRYVQNHAVNPPGPGDLTEEWERANEVVQKLQKDEEDLADNPSIQAVPTDNKLLLEFVRDPLVKNSFNTVPTEVAYVDLNQIVVHQHHIDLAFVQTVKDRVGPSPTVADLFRLCRPYGEAQQPPMKWGRVQGDTYVFVSRSNDLRFLGVMPLEARNIQDYPPPGRLAGIIGLAVGFGSNFLNAVYAERRLILNNGSHRAYALRQMGLTRVPCIVQHVSSREELHLLACTAVTDRPNYYFQEPRPPMLKDYFDPRLRKVMSVHRRLRQIRVKFEIDEGFIPAL